MIKLDIDGLDEARRELRALARGFDRQVVQPALLRAIEPMHRRVLDEVPHLTGVLAEHVEVVAPAPYRGRVHVSVAIRDVDYAAHRDLGTHDLEADDFMQRAFDSTARGAADVAEREILKNLP